MLLKRLNVTVEWFKSQMNGSWFGRRLYMDISQCAVLLRLPVGLLQPPLGLSAGDPALVGPLLQGLDLSPERPLRLLPANDGWFTRHKHHDHHSGLPAEQCERECLAKILVKTNASLSDFEDDFSNTNIA